MLIFERIASPVELTKGCSSGLFCSCMFVLPLILARCSFQVASPVCRHYDRRPLFRKLGAVAVSTSRG